MRAVLHAIDTGLGKVEKVIIQICVAVIALIMTAQVIFRYALNAPIYWAEEVCVIMLVNLTFFGLALLVHRRTLVAVNMLRNFVSVGVQRVIALLVAVIILVIVALLSYHSIIWVTDPMAHTELAETTGIPKWTLYAIMPVAMLAMTFHYIVYVTEFIFGEPGGDK